MTSHPTYPKLDPTGVPATFSRLIVHDYLRGEVGYRGVIVSDDLEMGAVSETCAIGEATVRAAGAGHDLLLVCHTEAAQRAAAVALVDAYRSGSLPRRDLEQAATRVRGLRERRAARAEGGATVPEIDGHALAMAIATRAVTVVSPGRADFRRALNGRVAAVFPRFSDLAGRITIEEALCDERAWLEGASAASGSDPRSHWWASSRERPRSPRQKIAPRGQTRRSSSSSMPISTRATARCSMPSRRGRGGSPSCSCAIPTTPACWRARRWASPPMASGAAS